MPICSKRLRRCASAVLVAVAAACAGKPSSDAPRGYTVTVTVSGVAGAGLVLQVNGGDDLGIPADGTYRFARGLLSGQAYAVTVAHHPAAPAQVCEVTGAQGTMADGGADVSVACYSAWRQVSTGSSLSAGIRPDGTLWTWGGNTRGGLGDGTTSASAEPVPLATTATWTAACAGYSHVVALGSDRTLWSWGSNYTGQLGDGTTLAHGSPAQVGSASDWRRVSAAGYLDYADGDGGHALALKEDGTLWAWGANRSGQLGNGTIVDSNAPIQIGTDTDWAEVWAGQEASFALKRDGSLWAWGRNADGQLGIGSTTEAHRPAQVGTATTWTAVAPGRIHTAALQQDGTLWTWGGNWDGALGNATTTARTTPGQVGSATWRAVAAGGYSNDSAGSLYNHTLAVRSDGTLWAWGSNNLGQLGTGGGEGATCERREDAVPARPCALSPVQVGTEADWAAPLAAVDHSLALKANGTLRAWGRNASGELGTGRAPEQVAPARVGVDRDWASVSTGGLHTLALKEDGSLWAWGDDASGQLGRGSFTGSSADPVQVGTATTWTGIAAGGAHSLAVQRSGRVWSWGRGSEAQLWFGMPARWAIPVDWSNVSSSVGAFSAVGAGDRFSLVLRTDGALMSVGADFDGQLGIGTTATARTALQQVQHGEVWAAVAAGFAHVLAREDRGQLWSWGSNWDGQTGTSTTTGQILWPTPVGDDADWAALAAGKAHSLAVKTGGSLWAWGSNASGQLGVPGVTEARAPARVGTGTAWAAVAAGTAHSLAVRTDGTLWAWGANASGQLGTGRGSPSAASAPAQVGTGADWAAVFAGGDCSLARRRDGTLWGWGANGSGQLGLGPVHPQTPVRVP